MPVVSVSLTEVGYEGYKGLPKGSRSRYIDRMLRDYALDHHHVQGRSIRDIAEDQKKMKITISTIMDENTQLKRQLKEARQ